MSVQGSARFTTSTKPPAPARKQPTLTGGTMGGVYWVREKKETDELKINRRNPTSAKQKNWQTGNVYKGSWIGDQRHGFGIQIWANGNKYEGMWKLNLRDGHGVLWIKDDPLAAAAAAAGGSGSGSAAAAGGKTGAAGGGVTIHASLTSTHQQNLQNQRDKQKRALHMMALTQATGGSTLSAATHAAAAAAEARNQVLASTGGGAKTAAAAAAAPTHQSAIPDGNGPIFDPLTKLRKLYAGNWKEGLKHGKGVYFYPNGASYEGEWRHGVRQGKGTLYLANGDIYVGEWSADKQSGFGTLTKANGDIYEGNWLSGKREGEGMYYYKSKEQIFEGEWVADIPKAGVFMSATDFFVGKDAKQQAAAAAAAAPAAGAAAAGAGAGAGASAGAGATATSSSAAKAADAKDSKYGPGPGAAATAATASGSAAGGAAGAAATASTAESDALTVQKTLGSLRPSDALAAVYKLPHPDPAVRATQQPKSVVLINVGNTNTDDLFDTPRFIRKDPKKPLPELRLANSDLVLAERIEQIQNERAAVRAMEAVALEELFDADALDELRRAYSSADHTGTGLVPITALKALLESVGEAVTDAELATICVDLDKNAADRMVFHNFVKAVHLAKHARALDADVDAAAAANAASAAAAAAMTADANTSASDDAAAVGDGDADGDGVDDGASDDLGGGTADAATDAAGDDGAGDVGAGDDRSPGVGVPQSPGGQSTASGSIAVRSKGVATEL